MRCKNCGWPNKPNETVCVKCGSPIDSEPQVMSNFDNGGGYQPQSPNENGDGLKKTVLESQVFGPSVEQPVQSTPTTQETVCPKCGYPMRADATKCPNCNFSVASVSGQSPNNNQPASVYQRRPTRMATTIEDEIPAQSAQSDRTVHEKTLKATRINTGKYNGTINPYMQNFVEEPMFILEPIQRMNERKPIAPIEFEGSDVTLTRDNTEYNNPTISSKGQAIVTHSEGGWFIEDLSEQKTTFVQAAHKIELHDGDIILLGNRLFKFIEQ